MTYADMFKPQVLTAHLKRVWHSKCSLFREEASKRKQQGKMVLLPPWARLLGVWALRLSAVLAHAQERGAKLESMVQMQSEDGAHRLQNESLILQTRLGYPPLSILMVKLAGK